MRSFLIKATFVTLLLAALLVLGGWGLASAAPLHPGDFFFPADFPSSSSPDHEP
jgi:hypothetical protein